MHCSFCRKPQHRTKSLISAPADYERAYICDECIRICANAIAQAPRLGHGRCSFCHLGAGTVRLQASAGDPPQALICEQCLAVCMSILDDDSPM